MYWHTSHGSQLITGMANLDIFMGGEGLYTFNNGGTGGALDIEEASDDLSKSVDNFKQKTEDYLDDVNHQDVNVVIWSWCGLLTDFDDIDSYLTDMNQLEQEYSVGGSKGRTIATSVKFVYMTGHLDGTGEMGNIHLANERIRAYCRTNDKFLYDFADIESYDPDDNYFLDKNADDACNYNDGNWAIEWQDIHNGVDTQPNGGEWYPCSAAHSQPLNGNLKAYSAWYLFAILA